MMIQGLIRVTRQVKINKEDENYNRYKRKSSSGSFTKNGSTSVCIPNQNPTDKIKPGCAVSAFFWRS